MAERKQEIKGSGLRRIAYIGKDGQLNFSRECVEEQKIREYFGPFTIPANPAALSETPDWLPLFNSEKTIKEEKQ